MFLGSINRMGTMKYWEHLRCNITTAKSKIPQKIRIGHTCLTTEAVIGAKLYITHHKKKEHVHKERNAVLYAIISFGTNASGDNTYFNDIMCVYDLGQTAQELKSGTDKSNIMTLLLAQSLA